MLNQLHPDAALLLISRGLITKDADMERNLGRMVRFINWTPSLGTQARDNVFSIIGVQKIYNGTLAYRVVCDAEGDTFGRPARPDQIEFCD